MVLEMHFFSYFSSATRNGEFLIVCYFLNGQMYSVYHDSQKETMEPEYSDVQDYIELMVSGYDKHENEEDEEFIVMKVIVCFYC